MSGNTTKDPELDEQQPLLPSKHQHHSRLQTALLTLFVVVIPSVACCVSSIYLFYLSTLVNNNQRWFDYALGAIGLGAAGVFCPCYALLESLNESQRRNEAQRSEERTEEYQLQAI